MKKLRNIAVFCLVLVLLGGIGAYAVGSYGSENDPLITLSYLEKVLQPELEQQYAAQLQKELDALEQELQAAPTGGYKVVTVKAGQTMICQTGCEFLVRSGSAYVSAGMLNVTAGSAANANDWLLAHNLYLATADDAYVTATGETLLLVRGEYTIK